MNFKSLARKFSLKKENQKILVGTQNESFRINWIEATLKKIPEKSRILDAGAGEQQFRKFCSHLKYVSQDFAQYKPENLDAGLQMPVWDYGKLDIISDIASIPEGNESFDAILCTEVFEHIINPREAIKEFSRLLKKNGQLILSAPFCSLTHFAPYHFYSGFNKFFYETELIQQGFKILEITPNGNYFEYLAQELNRLPSVGGNYSQVYVSDKEFDALQTLIMMLQKMSNQDKNSHELLCFGYQIVAQKL